ncbi:citramalate synthase [Limnochorda pilosa]|uniref:Citramalate synthase n=1 Tax=Limnochorda pilosa TaxID=1555112 RepID=A0A0K2SJ16_LIMPI|nr:citramalate synthase [Limnochorda pilosa]BAS27116.1 transferase [Limnochorda pilosa]
MSANLRDAVYLYDTTLRDGTQGEGISLSVEDKLALLRFLDTFGVAYVEGGWPGSNPKDLEFFRRAGDVPLQRARLAAFGSTRRPGSACDDDPNLAALLEAGTPVVTLFGKSWDLHVTQALRTSLEENLAMIRESVAHMAGQGREVVYDAEHFFDGYLRNPEYAWATLRAAREGGARWIVLCDTNGGTLPHEIERITAEVARRLDVPLGIHCHNDSGVAVANSLAAVRAGARQVQGTINGLGERTGNADLVTILPNLALKLGYRLVPEPQMERLQELSRTVSERVNRPPDPFHPFVGESAFAHKGGIHVSAVRRQPETYEHVPPERVGNRRRVLVSELSGASNVLYKAREYGLELDPETPVVRDLLRHVKELEHQGYHFEAGEASFELLLRRALGLVPPFFTLEGFRLTVAKGGPDGTPGPDAEATIRLRVGSERIHTAASGNGPVNALDHALRKALLPVYPTLASFRLVDYKVRVLDGQAGTAARVRVLIETAADSTRWGTVGVSTNIIEASWLALVDSVEYGLMKMQVERPGNWAVSTG